MPLVRSLARRYAGRGEPVDDLVQVGAIGLIKAIDRFELERGVELSTYAVPTIVGEIRRHFRDRSWSVHVPRRMKELSLRVSRLVDDLSSELGRAPTVAELAAAADVEEEDVIEALETARAHTPTSLSTPVDASGELTLIDLLGEDEDGLCGARARLGRPHRARRARGAGAADRRPPLPERADPVGDRRGARHLADARLAAAAPGARRNARPARRRRGDAVMTTADRYTLVFPARPEYLLLARLALTGVARLAQVDEEALADLRLAVTEAAANACRHAYADGVGDVTIHLASGGDDATRGRRRGRRAGLRRATRVDEWDAPTSSSEDGMGLAIIRAVADDVEIGTRDDGAGTRLRFTRSLR